MYHLLIIIKKDNRQTLYLPITFNNVKYSNNYMKE